MFLAPGEARNLPSEPKRRICGEMGAGGGGRGGVELRNVVDLRYGSTLTFLKKNLPVKYCNELNYGSIELVGVRVRVKRERKLRFCDESRPIITRYCGTKESRFLYRK